MNYCTECGKPTDNGFVCRECMIAGSPWLSAMKIKENDLEEEVAKLKAENNSLRERLKKVVIFARDYCAEDDCAGDDTVGIPPCEMWQFGDEDENGNWIKGGCMLEMWQKELAEERKDGNI